MNQSKYFIDGFVRFSIILVPPNQCKIVTIHHHSDFVLYIVLYWLGQFNSNTTPIPNNLIYPTTFSTPWSTHSKKWYFWPRVKLIVFRCILINILLKVYQSDQFWCSRAHIFMFSTRLFFTFFGVIYAIDQQCEETDHVMMIQTVIR